MKIRGVRLVNRGGGKVVSSARTKDSILEEVQDLLKGYIQSENVFLKWKRVMVGPPKKGK